MFGIKIKNTKETGSTIKCTGKVSQLGLMVERMMEIMKMIKSTAMELLFGRTVESMLVTGRMVSNMEEDSITWRMDKQKLENGYREKR